MKKINWEMLGTLATILSLIIAVALAWDQLEARRYLIFLAVVVMTGSIFLVAGRHRVARVLKPKPRLNVTVRDVNCLLTTRTYMIDNRVSVRKKVRETKMQVEIAFKVKNRGRARATDVSTSLKLVLGQDNGVISFVADPKGQAKKLNLVSGQTLPLIVRFPPVEISQQELTLYPNGPYCLEYTYVCAERLRPQTVAVSGRLTKADWTGAPDALEIVREMGFYR